jgi:hypothetical protein
MEFTQLPLDAAQLLDRLRRNELPSVSEAPLVRQFHDELHAELAQIDQQIQILGQRRQDVERRMALCSSLTAPIRRLSADVLGDIFLLTKPMNEIDMGSFPRVPGNKIRNVCAYWNDVAMGTANLWSDISVSLYGRGLEKIALGALKTLCLRSGDGVNLSITLDLEFFRNQRGDLKTILNTLLASAHRWISFDVRCWYEHMAHLEKIGGSLSYLKSLNMELCGEIHDRRCFPPGQRPMFEGAKSLKQLTFKHDTGPRVHPFNLLWHQHNLEHLWIDSPYSLDFIRACLGRNPPHGAHETECYGFLKYLHITLPPKESPSFDCLAFPALRHLMIVHLEGYKTPEQKISWGKSGLNSCLLHSMHTLETLKLCSVFLTDELLCSILENLPCLREFALWEMKLTISESSISRLTIKASSLPLLPCLRDLTLDASVWCLSPLLELVKSRSSLNTRIPNQVEVALLQKVSIGIDAGFPQHMRPMLSLLNESGVSVDVRYGSTHSS